MKSKYIKSIAISIILLLSVVTDQTKSAEVFAVSSTAVEQDCIQHSTQNLSSIYNNVSEQYLSSTNKTTSYILQRIRHSSHTTNLTPDLYYNNIHVTTYFPISKNYRYIREIRVNPGDKIIRYIHDQDGEKDGAFL